jgi:hypothetical protein
MSASISIDLLKQMQTPPVPQLRTISSTGTRLRLVRLDEITEENPSGYRGALANVYATLDAEEGTQFLYLLEGQAGRVTLYFGVIEAQHTETGYEAMKNLRSALEGQLPGIHLTAEVDEAEIQAITARLAASPHRGLVLGVPTVQEEGADNDEEDFQGIERLVRTLTTGPKPDEPNTAYWQLAIVFQPLTRETRRQQLEAAFDLGSSLAPLVRTSIQASGNTSEQKGHSYSVSTAQGENVSRSDAFGRSEGASETKGHGKSYSTSSSSSSSGTNTNTSETKNVGTNESVTKTTGTSTTHTQSDSASLSRTQGGSLSVNQEITDKRAQHLLDHLEKQLIPRLQKGVTKGLLCTATYLFAENPSTYRRLKNTFCATYQGGEPTLTPLQVLDVPAAGDLSLPLLSKPLAGSLALFHSLHAPNAGPFGSLLTVEELALIAGLPRRELPGLKRRKIVDFAVDLPKVPDDYALQLGEVIDRGRRQPKNPLCLNTADFNKHIFVTGVTGAGKTTTCLNLLLESRLPFLVIEPAKTEYRVLASQIADLSIYRPNGDLQRSLRINPFALVHKGQTIKSHASLLRNIFAAVFPLEASMPYLIEQAILRAYEEKGWNLTDNSFLVADNPFDPAARAWPTMSDMIRQLDILIPEQGMGREFEEKYRGSLVSRLTSLTHGVLGDVLDVPQSLDFVALLDQRVVIELEEVKDSEGKALMMALLLGNISEAIRHRHRNNPDFRHLTLVEEAHRLLSRPEAGDAARSHAVEEFANLLAEVRKYGEGLIIADQIPAKLIPDVIKNTHVKIVHRLFAEDDRNAMGEAMMMDDKQRDFLPNLAAGEAIVFCGGWHAPVHAQIRSDGAQTDRPPLPEAAITAKMVAQLWGERARYYPLLTRLDPLVAGDAPEARFADFIQQSRTALLNLLRINPYAQPGKNSSSSGALQKIADRSLAKVQQWLTTWQPLVRDDPDYAARWQALSGLARPCHPLTAPLLTLMLDSNPRPLTQAKNPPAWVPLLDGFDWPLWVRSLDALLDVLEAATDAKDFKDRLQPHKLQPRELQRDLMKVLEQVGQFQSF